MSYPIPDEKVLLASAARTADTNTDDQDNIGGHRGVVVFIDCTAITDSPSVVFTIQGREPSGDEYYDILASAAVVGAGNTVLKVYPGLTAAANTVANDVLPRRWRVNCNHADADSITYSVGAILLP